MARTLAALLTVLAALVLVACGSGTGSTAAPSTLAAASTAASPASVALSPPAASSAPPASPAATASGSPVAQETPMHPFELTSTAFTPGGSIPRRFTCDGEGGSPDLAWSGAPDGTGALVLIVDDPDANGFVHWIVYDMSGTGNGALPTGISASPEAPPQGTNSFGKIGWGGPCPPSGEHRYVFTLTALAEPLGLSGAPKPDAVRAAMAKGTVLGSATLEGRYRRGG